MQPVLSGLHLVLSPRYSSGVMTVVSMLATIQQHRVFLLSGCAASVLTYFHFLFYFPVKSLSFKEFWSYQLSILHPANLRFRFPAGHTGHGVITTEVFLCAADVLHPLRKSWKWANSQLQFRTIWLHHNYWEYQRAFKVPFEVFWHSKVLLLCIWYFWAFKNWTLSDPWPLLNSCQESFFTQNDSRHLLLGHIFIIYCKMTYICLISVHKWTF